MTTVQLDAKIAAERKRHAERVTVLAGKEQDALDAKKVKKANEFATKLLKENSDSAKKIIQFQARRLAAQENGGAEVEAVKEPVVTHGWVWRYFEPIGTALKEHKWKRAIGQFAMRVLPLVIVLLIALNALKGCAGLNN